MLFDFETSACFWVHAWDRFNLLGFIRGVDWDTPDDLSDRLSSTTTCDMSTPGPSPSQTAASVSPEHERARAEIAATQLLLNVKGASDHPYCVTSEAF